MKKSKKNFDKNFFLQNVCYSIVHLFIVFEMNFYYKLNDVKVNCCEKK